MTHGRLARRPSTAAPGGSRAATRTPAPLSNRGVARMLARQEDDVVVDLLTLAEERKAIAFYTAQPWLYSEAIIRQVQSAVGATESGVADAETVQAVARWQAMQGDNDPALKIDGMAGPRTLPRMFPSGLNATGQPEGFGEEAQTGVIDRWGELDPKGRAAELVRIVNGYLDTAGVPPVIPNPKDTGNDAGAFDFPTWQMEIGLNALSADVLDRAAAAEIVDTIYHEARHAEQWFRMAELRASQGLGAAAIKTELGIPLNIAKLAVQRKAAVARGSMEAVIAQGWYDSVYGDFSAHREAVLNEVEAAATARKKAKERFDKSPTAANKLALEAARARFDKAHAAYEDLPEENDAWATGPQAGAAVTRGTPPPPADLLKPLGELTGVPV